MQEKVLVLDIDGTLTNSKKEITEADPGFRTSHARYAEM